jgi:small subunit ribosomal protein S15e
MSKGKAKAGAKKDEVVVKKEEKKVLKPLPDGVQNIMADLSKKQIFKKFSFRGLDINSLLNLDIEQVSKLLRSRQRRRLQRKLKPEYGRLITKLNFIKKCTPLGEKPLPIKTHLRDLIVLPSLVLSNVNIHNGKEFVPIEVKPEMIGYYLGEFSQTYKRVAHGKPGVGATASSKFAPIK